MESRNHESEHAAQAPALSHEPDEFEQFEDFGKALERWEGGLKSLKEGDVVHGRVLKILDKEVIVDIGYKSEGVIDIDEVRSPDGSLSVHVGDRIEVLLEKRVLRQGDLDRMLAVKATQG